MRVSFKGDYALKALLDLAEHRDSGLVKIQEIARRRDIPIKFLEQIMLILKGNGYVISQRGAKGGYRLAKEPRRITLGEVIRLMEGPISPITCVSKSCYQKCNEEEGCVFRPIWDNIRVMTEKVVDGTTLEDVRHRSCDVDASTYQI